MTDFLNGWPISMAFEKVQAGQSSNIQRWRLSNGDGFGGNCTITDIQAPDGFTVTHSALPFVLGAPGPVSANTNNHCSTNGYFDTAAGCADEAHVYNNDKLLIKTFLPSTPDILTLQAQSAPIDVFPATTIMGLAYSKQSQTFFACTDNSSDPRIIALRRNSDKSLRVECTSGKLNSFAIDVFVFDDPVINKTWVFAVHDNELSVHRYDADGYFDLINTIQFPGDYPTTVFFTGEFVVLTLATSPVSGWINVYSIDKRTAVLTLLNSTATPFPTGMTGDVDLSTLWIFHLGAYGGNPGIYTYSIDNSGVLTMEQTPVVSFPPGPVPAYLYYGGANIAVTLPLPPPSGVTLIQRLVLYPPWNPVYGGSLESLGDGALRTFHFDTPAPQNDALTINTRLGGQGIDVFNVGTNSMGFVEVAFKPSIIKSYSGEIVVTHDASMQPSFLPVSGTSVEAVPTPLDIAVYDKQLSTSMRWDALSMEWFDTMAYVQEIKDANPHVQLYHKLRGHIPSGTKLIKPTIDDTTTPTEGAAAWRA